MTSLLRPTLSLPVPAVRLRPWQLADAEPLTYHANNPEIAHSLRDVFPHPYSLDDACFYLGLVMDSASLDLNLAIEVGGEAAGSISALFQTDVNRRSAEVGYWLGRQFWGRGIATAAVQALSSYVFAHFDLMRLYGLVYAPNLASAKVLQKAGYDLEGRLRQAITKNNQPLDALLFAKVQPPL